MFENLLCEKNNRVYTIKINRTSALNSLNEKVLEELDKALDIFANDKDLYVAIISGEGKAFVAGADIACMSNMTVQEAKNFSKKGMSIFRKIELIEKPIIAAVNGPALGGGCELAISCDIRIASQKAKFGQPEVKLGIIPGFAGTQRAAVNGPALGGGCELAISCDIRIASQKAKFGQPEVKLGIIPGFAGTQRLSKLVGVSKAKELIYTGDMIAAEEALNIGLVNKVVEPDMLMEEAMNMANKIASNAQLAVRYAKASINKSIETNIDTGMDIENYLFAICFDSKDQREGMQAFLEKRVPQFIGE